MTKREIVQINEDKCNGCGECIPNCAEGALQIIDGKAKLVSDQYCDGLGACLGHCPQNALTVIEREADEYNEEAVKQHLKEKEEHLPHKALADLPCGCPGSMVIDRRDTAHSTMTETIQIRSQLRQWPIQLKLVPSNAPYLQNADLLIAADCVPFTYANFHLDFLKGKVLLVGCPKLDDADYYRTKLTDIIQSNDIQSITLVNMEVPCCFGLQQIIEEALQQSNKIIPLRQTIITTKGEKQ